MVGQQDLNLRPEVPETSALPDCAMPRHWPDRYAWRGWLYWPNSGLGNVFRRIYIEKLFFIGYDRNSTYGDFCEANSGLESLFHEISIERTIFGGGKRFS